MQRLFSALLVLTTIGACTLTEFETPQPPEAIDCTVTGDTATFNGEQARHNGVCRYEGIQFASADGELRFASPEPIEPRGNIKATDSDHVCLHKWSLQNERISGESWNIGEEDCLYLNIYTPTSAATASEKLPVMVFIHGGAFVLGAGSWEIYESSNLAARDAVVVTINYRLGPFGFLAPDAYTPDDPSGKPQGNQGIEDQIAALDWVQKYISDFGGDANNVTIFGESAGAMSVCTLMATSKAQGKFHKAIMQSGSCNAVSTLEEMSAFAATYATQAGCPVSGTAALDCMRDKDANALMRRLKFDAVGDGLQPTIDNIMLTDSPLAMIKQRGTNVPLLAGSNVDEVRILGSVQAPIADLRNKAFPEYQQSLVRAYGGDFAEGAGKIYNSSNYDNPFDAWTQMQSDWLLSCPTYLAADTVQSLGGTSYHYEFAWRPTNALGEQLGSHHAMELFFVFDSLDSYSLLFSKDDEAKAHTLADAIQAAWVSFARDGKPSAIESWQTTANGSIVLDNEIKFGPSRLKPACEFLEPYLARGLQNGIEPLLDYVESGLE